MWFLSLLLFNLLLGQGASCAEADSSAFDAVPCAYQGRIRPCYGLQDSPLQLLPSRSGEWFPLAALTSPGNFTPYPDALFASIRDTYQQDPSSRHLAELLRTGYAQIAGSVYREAAGKQLRYPFLAQLKAELFYLKTPLVEAAALAYGLAALCLLLFKRSMIGGRVLLIIAFALHTLLLALRIYILGRPPVANMYETMLYVPWVAVALSALLLRRRTPIIAGTIVSFGLLLLLMLSPLNDGLEPVQAVLDSSYWLTVHVLLVVGSYGAFALSSALSHLYLITSIRKKPKTLMSGIIASLYVGVAMLISGTLLGGVWAAESWGRFWDWDPKESWAFISAAVYLIGIHAHRFQKIGDYGLAVASVVGFLAISFTWYGVNYILGTGLHSYGFGTGGLPIYLTFIFAELLFLGTIPCLRQAEGGTLSPQREAIRSADTSLSSSSDWLTRFRFPSSDRSFRSGWRRQE